MVFSALLRIKLCLKGTVIAAHTTATPIHYRIKTDSKRKLSRRGVMNVICVVGNTATGVSNMADVLVSCDHVMWKKLCYV
jgi:hypothetical protein